MAVPNTSELLSTTMQYLEDELVDNISNNNALLYELKQRDNVKSFDGGPKIVQPIEYAENVTYLRYSGAEQLDISPSTVFSAAEFALKQVALSVTITGLEQLQNSGKSKVFDLLESRIKNLKRTFENNFSTDIYSDGTGTGGKQVGGIQLLIAATPTTGTVGGINRATWSFWQNQTFGGVADGGAAVSAANILSYMNKLWLKCCTRTEKPTLITADNNYFEYFEEALQAIQRITTDGRANKMADAGFQSYLYKGTPVVFDGGLGGAHPANKMYFINGNYVKLRPHRDRDLKTLNPDRFALNQDALVRLVAWAGNMTISNCRLQGVLKA